MNSYYNTYILRYLMADQKTRQASKKHWLKCHRENIEKSNGSLETDFLLQQSAMMLASISLADEYIETHTMPEAN